MDDADSLLDLGGLNQNTPHMLSDLADPSSHLRPDLPDPVPAGLVVERQATEGSSSTSSPPATYMSGIGAGLAEVAANKKKQQQESERKKSRGQKHKKRHGERRRRRNHSKRNGRGPGGHKDSATRNVANTMLWESLDRYVHAQALGCRRSMLVLLCLCTYVRTCTNTHTHAYCTSVYTFLYMHMYIHIFITQERCSGDGRVLAYSRWYPTQACGCTSQSSQ